MISIVTPWHNCPELIKPYEAITEGAQLVIVDNGSEPATAQQLRNMCNRREGVYIRNDHNMAFAASNNVGYCKATSDIVLFMNNDIRANSATWLEQVWQDVEPGGLYGPELSSRYVDGRAVLYIAGWCIAARRETWDAIAQANDGMIWDSRLFKGNYWEDNDLCFRAIQLGIKLHRTAWPLQHINNYTSNQVQGAKDASQVNQVAFEERVRRAWVS